MIRSETKVEYVPYMFGQYPPYYQRMAITKYYLFGLHVWTRKKSA